jgi:hypothetical protein
MRCLKLKFGLAVFSLVVGIRPGQCQTSELYMLNSPNVVYPYGTTSVYQGGHQIRSWIHAAPYELPVAVVGGTVRQAAGYNLQGSEYSLTGVPTGRRFPATANAYDATSDGTSIYAWNWATATLMRYDLDWRFQRNVFSLGATYQNAFMGITYDPQNNSVWLASWNMWHGFLYDYSLDGHLLGTLALANPQASGNGLAYDPADNTLWFFSWTDHRYEQYSKDGRLLGTIAGMDRIYGAEFMMVPEPATTALLAVVLVVSLRRNQERSPGEGRR